MITRTLTKTIESKLSKGKAIVLVGPRQVGKTTLIKELLSSNPYLFLNGDDPMVKSKLTNPSSEDLKTILGNSKIVFIDEAQRIENIGITLKIIHDQFKEVQLLVSGSSAFELKNEMNEPLTGRKWEYNLYPISYEEYENEIGYIAAQSDLENRLIYGFYPDIINNKGSEVELLNQLTESYLYKDILSYANIKKPDVLEKILQALAFQVGNEVSFNEIAQLVGVDKNTVGNYIRLLELGYVVYALPSFSRNLRNEIKTNKKYYFYDNGIRNTLIQNFNPIAFRSDIGALWENFLISERLKRNHYHFNYVNSFFWRTIQQQEVDYVEEKGGKIEGFEFKWSPKAKIKIPKNFISAYDASFTVINKDNFRDFVTKKFETTIDENKPNAYYIYNAVVNLHQGNVSSRQITEGKELLFEPIVNTTSSHVTFVGSDLRDGFLNVYFIVLDNGKAFLYLHGNASSKSLSRGGYFMDIDLNHIDHTIIEHYLKDNVKKWSNLYSQRELIKLINAVNNSFDEIFELMQ